MSTHYAIDVFGNPVSGAAILDIIETPTGTSPLAGNFVVRVPDGLSVQKPTNLGDLITKKYSAYLAFYSIFTRVAYDDLLNPLDIDPAPVSGPGMFGDRGNIRINAAGILQSLMVGLLHTPSQALITWETHTITQTDLESTTVARTYTEVPSDVGHVTCQVSFDNGATWLSCLDGQVLWIPPVNRGTSFKIRLTNVYSTPLNISSWALVY